MANLSENETAPLSLRARRYADGGGVLPHASPPCASGSACAPTGVAAPSSALGRRGRWRTRPASSALVHFSGPAGSARRSNATHSPHRYEQRASRSSLRGDTVGSFPLPCLPPSHPATQPPTHPLTQSQPPPRHPPAPPWARACWHTKSGPSGAAQQREGTRNRHRARTQRAGVRLRPSLRRNARP
jgi:hypothetical protein